MYLGVQTLHNEYVIHSRTLILCQTYYHPALPSPHPNPTPDQYAGFYSGSGGVMVLCLALCIVSKHPPNPLHVRRRNLARFA